MTGGEKRQNQRSSASRFGPTIRAIQVKGQDILKHQVNNIRHQFVLIKAFNDEGI